MSTPDATAHEPATAAADLLVSELSEEALLAAFTPLLPRSDREVVGNGDDCAVLASPDGRYVVSTDVLVEGHHFRTDWSCAREVGRRAAAQNLADAAAMGARPTALVMSLVLPGSTPVAWVQDMARGLAEACAPVGAGVVGGDLSGGEALVLAVTVHGDLEGRDPVLRSGARPGDLLVHVGVPGRSLAGYELLAAGWEPNGAPAPGPSDVTAPARATSQPGSRSAADVAFRCQSLFRAPEPPLAAGPALADAGATAMMDVSDSLLRDAGRIARASGVLIDVNDPADPGSPLHADVLALAPVAALLEPDAESAGRDVSARARQWVLTGGEDHGMLATVPADAVDRLPQGAAVIGTVETPAESGPGVLVGGRPWEGSVGWDHFSA